MSYFSWRRTPSVSVDLSEELLSNGWADRSVVIVTNNCSLQGWETRTHVIRFDVTGTMRPNREIQPVKQLKPLGFFPSAALFRLPPPSTKVVGRHQTKSKHLKSGELLFCRHAILVKSRPVRPAVWFFERNGQNVCFFVSTCIYRPQPRLSAHYFFLLSFTELHLGKKKGEERKKGGGHKRTSKRQMAQGSLQMTSAIHNRQAGAAKVITFTTHGGGERSWHRGLSRSTRRANGSARVMCFSFQPGESRGGNRGAITPPRSMVYRPATGPGCYLGGPAACFPAAATCIIIHYLLICHSRIMGL